MQFVSHNNRIPACKTNALGSFFSMVCTCDWKNEEIHSKKKNICLKILKNMTFNSLFLLWLVHDINIHVHVYLIPAAKPNTKNLPSIFFKTQICMQKKCFLLIFDCDCEYCIRLTVSPRQPLVTSYLKLIKTKQVFGLGKVY